MTIIIGKISVKIVTDVEVDMDMLNSEQVV